MKLAFYALAGVALAGLGMGMRSPFGQSGENASPIGRERAGVVYVDVDRLMSLHPAWDALDNMRRVSAQVSGSAAGGAAQTGLQRGSDDGGASSAAAERAHPISRQSLEAEAARAAIEALHELELEKRQALWERVNSIRQAMTRAVEAEVAVRARDVESKSSAETLAAERSYCPDRLRAALKLAALQAAVGIPELNTQDARARLAGVREELHSLDQACDAEKAGIASVAGGRIAYMREAALRTVDDRVRTHESEGKARIDLDIAQARDRIIGELTSVGEPVAPAPFVGVFAGRPTAAASRTEQARQSIRGSVEIGASADALEKLVKDDIVRVVEELAAERGLNVVFERPAGPVIDRTGTFAGLVRDGAWRWFRPVLAESLRS